MDIGHCLLGEANHCGLAGHDVRAMKEKSRDVGYVNFGGLEISIYIIM